MMFAKLDINRTLGMGEEQNSISHLVIEKSSEAATNIQTKAPTRATSVNDKDIRKEK